MKKIFSFASAIVALAAMSSLTSCQKENFASKESQDPQIVMTVNAGACDDIKTFIASDGQDGYVPCWSEGDRIRVLELISGKVNQTAESAPLGSDTYNATFTVSLTSKTADSFTYTSVYPADAYGTGSGSSVFYRLDLAEEQTFTATSFDPAADLMISKPETLNEQPATLSQQFRRIGATAKMQINGVHEGEVIKSVEFSTTETYIAGFSKFDPVTAEWLGTYSSSKKSISLTPAETMTATGADVVWFRVYAAVLEDNFTVETTTDKAVYTKTVDLKTAARELEFRNAALTSFKVGYSESDRKPLSTAVYELVTDVNDLVAGDVVRLGCASKNIAAGDVAGTAAKPYLSAADATIENGLLSSQDALDFTLGGTSGAWTFTTGDSRILATSAVNTINLSGDGTTTWTIAINDAGVATITSTNTGCGTIKSYGGNRFNTYASGQTSIELYKLDTDPRERQILSFPQAAYSVKKGTDFTAPTVSGAKTTPVTYSSSDESVATVNASTGAVTIIGGGKTTITATAPESDSFKSGSASYELTVLAPLTTMDEIFAAATAAGSTATDVCIDFKNWVISGVKDDNAYITDNKGKGFIINASGHGFEVEDVLSGAVDTKIKLYHGSAQVSGLTSETTGLKVEKKGGTVTPVEDISIAGLGGVNTGAVITFGELQYNGEAFTDGTNTITPYPSLAALPLLVKGLYYDVTGVYVQYNTTKEIAPRSADDFLPLDKLYLNANASKTSNISADGETVTITVETNVEGGWTAVSSDNTNFTLSDKTDASVKVTAAKNTDTQNGRTATITISAEGVDDVVITLSQNKAGAKTVVWDDDFSGVTENKSTALTSLSGSKDGFKSAYSDVKDNKIYPMGGAIRIASASAAGKITTPALSGINGTKNLTITLTAAGWKAKSTKLTLTANNAGTVTEGETKIDSEDSMTTSGGASPTMTGKEYTFHVTGATSATTITLSANYSIGIDDLKIVVD